MKTDIFYAALNQKLTDAGFTLEEIELGTHAAQARTVTAMVQAGARGNPMLLMAALGMSNVISRLLAELAYAKNVDAMRVFEASEIIGDACLNRARDMVGSGDKPEQSAPPTGMDATGPAHPHDVN